MATGTQQIRRFERPHSSLKTSQQETPSNNYKQFILPETRVMAYIFAADNVGLHSLVFTQLCFKVDPS